MSVIQIYARNRKTKPNTETEERGNYGILIGQQILPIISAMPVMLSLCWVLLLRLRAYICNKRHLATLNNSLVIQ